MKKGEFYITTNAGIQKRDGYILQTARNVYGIHNGGSYCKNWIVTDLKTGLQVRDNFRTRKAAGDFIESTPTIEEKILAMHNDPNNDFINNCIKAINQAHTENPIDNTKPRRPVTNGFYVYTYTSTSGTERAAIAPRSNPDEYFLDVYAEDLAKHIQQIIDTTPGAYFTDKTTGLDIDPAKLDTTPAPEQTPASTPTAKTEPKRNRLPRKFTRLYITMLTDTTAGQAGTRATVYRNQYGELVEETESGQIYAANLALLRTADLVRIDRIETAPTADTTPADVISDTTPAPVTAAETTPAPDVSQESNTESAPETSPTLYKYGMRTRGYSIGAQPAGVVTREDDPSGIYYDVIIYERELTPAELDHYSLDPLQPAREPGTTLPPGPKKAPEPVTEPPTASQKETPLTPHTKPRRALTSPAKTASHTSTHGRPKTPYKAKYKAARTHSGPTRTPRFSKSTYFLALALKNPARINRIRFMGPVFEPIIDHPHNGGPPGG